MSSPWLTIVIPVRDDKEGLQRTLTSTARQKDEDVQVLVVDSSRDHDAVVSMCSGIAQVIQVAPEGVFPAMNTGLDRAAGTFVQFLGAGDQLHDSVLARVRKVADLNPEWMFGPVRIIGTHGRHTVTPHWDYAREVSHLFARGFFPQHQGTFARTELLRNFGGFSSSFRVAADYALFLRLSQHSTPVRLDFVVADFTMGGVSTTRWRESFHEFHRARQEIFRPAGLVAAQEQWDYRTHFARVWGYRELVEPLRRRARR
ncbi:MAG: glycosyltransferase [Actinomycetia bacterium]|nr:glycosyltransferase [Actinomycetes bacterium]